MLIDIFKASVAANPIMDPARFTVSISGPAGIYNRIMQLNCSAVNIPGKGYSTTDLIHEGPIRKMPYEELYDDVVTTFYVTENMVEQNYFIEWMEKISGKETYDLGWYRDFVGSVIIETQNKWHMPWTKFELIEAYPVAISDVQLSYSAGEEIPTIDVTWSYHHWERRPNTTFNAVSSARDAIQTAI